LDQLHKLLRLIPCISVIWHFPAGFVSISQCKIFSPGEIINNTFPGIFNLKSNFKGCCNFCPQPFFKNFCRIHYIIHYIEFPVPFRAKTSSHYGPTLVGADLSAIWRMTLLSEFINPFATLLNHIPHINDHLRMPLNKLHIKSIVVGC
jgi:hypothetical protein